MTSDSRPEQSSDPSAEVLEGTVRRIVYASPETGWTVIRLKIEGEPEPVAAVGRLLGVQPGEELRLTGRWVSDRKFGRQFHAESYVGLEPSTAEGIRRYLGSGLIPGIGKEMARRLVDRFGVRTLEIIDATPKKLTEVDGIGPVRAAGIRRAWVEQREIRNVMIFLHSHGLSTGFATKIFKHYGERTIAAVKENPYRLAREIFGIGFQTADRIAASLGLPRDGPERIGSGLLYALAKSADEGHVFLPRPLLLERATHLLEVETGPIDAVLKTLTGDSRLIREELASGEQIVFHPELHAAETGVCRQVVRLLSRPAKTLQIDLDRALLWFEQREGLELAPLQSEATRRALTSKVLIITGGPGTGKTTLVRAVVEILSRKGRRALLAAPTGRAANRLSEAAGAEAKTVHRLLEFDPHRMVFQRHRERPLEADVVIVDEASMLDCFLADALTRAVPDPAQLILVGDVDQLPSVGPGMVLAHLIESGRIPVVRLQQIYRQASRSLIVENAHHIRRGEAPVLEKAEEADFFFIERHEPEQVLSTILHLVSERIPGRFGCDPKVDIQVLAPMRRGLIGVENLNLELQNLLNPQGQPLTAGRRLRLGDRVMQIRNNYDLDVFNGDVGRIRDSSPDGSVVRIAFDSRTVDYEAAELDQITLAYCCSVHKAQGSEYPFVVLPIHSQHFIMLQRNLLYTAVTRGQRLVTLVGEPRALATAVRNDRQRQRFTRLSQRLIAGE